MVEDVEKLRPQLQVDSLRNCGVLHNSEIYIPEVRTVNCVPSQTPKLPGEVGLVGDAGCENAFPFRYPIMSGDDSQLGLIGFTPGTMFGRW